MEPPKKSWANKIITYAGLAAISIGTLGIGGCALEGVYIESDPFYDNRPIYRDPFFGPYDHYRREPFRNEPFRRQPYITPKPAPLPKPLPNPKPYREPRITPRTNPEPRISPQPRQAPLPRQAPSQPRIQKR